MNPKHLHTPTSSRARCPVCHQPVYSHAGIHPQCAMNQSDPRKPKAGVVPPPVGAEPEAVAAAIPDDPPAPAVPPAASRQPAPARKS